MNGLEPFSHEGTAPSAQAAQVHATASLQASIPRDTVDLQFATPPAPLRHVAESYHGPNMLNYPYGGGRLSHSHEEFLKSEFLHERTKELVARINRYRHHCELIERFCIADHPAAMESGELTPTLKVRRNFIEEKYADGIEEMYASIGGTK